MNGVVGLMEVSAQRQREHSVKCEDLGHVRVTRDSQNYGFKQNAFKNGQGILRLLYWEDNHV